MGLAHTWSFALIVVLTLGCEGGPHFVERELLLGNGGTYELSALNVRDVDDVSVSVSGEAVTAQLTSEPGLLGPRAVVRVEAVAEGVSVVELQRREDARVIDQLSIEVARVEELRVEQVLEEARTKVIVLSADEQLLFWTALQKPGRLTKRQRKLGELMRGER